MKSPTQNSHNWRGSNACTYTYCVIIHVDTKHKMRKKLFCYKTEVPVSNTYAWSIQLAVTVSSLHHVHTYTNYNERPTSNWISTATPSKP
jgi:hypothetical protein